MKSNNKWSYGVVLLAYAVVCTTAYAATTATTVVAAQDPASAPGNALGDASARRSLLTNGAADEPQVQGNGNITELQQMIRDGKVVEMRTTYNGSYGASLLFYPDVVLRRAVPAKEVLAGDQDADRHTRRSRLCRLRQDHRPASGFGNPP